ncbi:nuclear transport factor 2 family protein [Dongshaea marina]|uniref:nuclear transport factor 2 family protein n=1 Tax=Dongshaea marina TaxID=2047966 RepID=UPI000D3E0F91|nr:nuclear transport factor 2 family protein [Dongshaea marina]
MTIDKARVQQIFQNLETGDADAFFSHVSPDVDWTVMGTHPLAGHYRTLDAFRKSTFERLTPCLTQPIQLVLQHIFVEGNTAIVELLATSKSRAGWDFDNHYCWIVTFADHTIVEVRAYLDSAMVAKLITEHEA